LIEFAFGLLKEALVFEVTAPLEEVLQSQTDILLPMVLDEYEKIQKGDKHLFDELLTIRVLILLDILKVHFKKHANLDSSKNLSDQWCNIRYKLPISKFFSWFTCSSHTLLLRGTITASSKA
jgi:hypothetical protein